VPRSVLCTSHYPRPFGVGLTLGPAHAG
jgi:hypothetical protein